MKRYSPKDIESKWQETWQQEGTYVADLDSQKPKYIGMSMFNYPSGAGIHIGHALNYTISDVIARAKRQQGYESYHPVGWDSFGMPAENYAIKAGISPQESMAQIIPSYHKQYQAMGWSNDWTKEIAAHKPEYYKWTQWLFQAVHKAGLAYQDARSQWWCDNCQTVLANEQVEANGKCWRHDGDEYELVQKREVKQWFFKVTDYADEILQATDELDWTPLVKTAQKNWIGKSEGAEITFKVSGLGQEDSELDVFTTRPDTLAGVSFMVLAPEHPLVKKYAGHADNAVEIEEYVTKALRKSEVERLADKHKSGVALEGLYAKNPLNGAQIPVWVAEYVLFGYGTGAIMAVPAHDDRDNEFARKYGLDYEPVIIPENTYDLKQFDYIDGDYVEGDIAVGYADSDQGLIEQLKNDVVAKKVVYRGEGLLINSGKYDGIRNIEAGTKIVSELIKISVADKKVMYKIRDWSVSRQRYWGAPIPIIHCKGCGPVLVPEEDLPVVLPELEDFKPSGDGRSALARATDWLKTECPNCKSPAERETDTLDTYMCSSWYMLRYTDPHNAEAPFSSERANKWMPIDFYNGGDHATAHMIYARFMTRFLHKQGMLDNPEPFKRFLFNGKVTASDGTNFSKSKGNGVDPLEVINDGYGADALRTYLMFAGPLELWTKWDPQGVPGAYRFLNRLWVATQEFISKDTSKVGADVNRALLNVTHSTIAKVTADIDANKYNTAVSSLMALVNELFKLKDRDKSFSSKFWRFALESVVQLTAPFAPHMAEELWQELGHKDSVHVDHWPELDEQYLVKDTMMIAIQVNGRVRGEIEVPAEASEESVLAAAKQVENVVKHIENGTKREIYVKGRLVNFVV